MVNKHIKKILNDIRAVRHQSTSLLGAGEWGYGEMYIAGRNIN